MALRTMRCLSPAQEATMRKLILADRNCRCRAARLVCRPSLGPKPDFAFPRSPRDDAGPPRAPGDARPGRSLTAVGDRHELQQPRRPCPCDWALDRLGGLGDGRVHKAQAGSSGRAQVPPKSRAIRRWSAAAILLRLALSLRLSS